MTNNELLANHGIHPAVPPINERNEFRFSATCTCGTAATLEVAGSHYEFVKRQFRRLGWSFREHFFPRCKECAAAKKSSTRMPPKLQPAVDFKLALTLRDLFETCFDEGLKIYRDDWSDAMVATRVDTTEDVVTKYRLEVHGEPLKPEDPRQAELQAKYNALVNDYDALAALVQQGREKLATFGAELGKPG